MKELQLDKQHLPEKKKKKPSTNFIFQGKKPVEFHL